ncbi:MAG: hypothetical protein IAE86_12840 [Burkholderiaceae bacterium]|nr:hypothetical protein [Burkholderiaceae bacterium]
MRRSRRDGRRCRPEQTGSRIALAIVTGAGKSTLPALLAGELGHRPGEVETQTRRALAAAEV